MVAVGLVTDVGFFSMRLIVDTGFFIRWIVLVFASAKLMLTLAMRLEATLC